MDMQRKDRGVEGEHSPKKPEKKHKFESIEDEHSQLTAAQRARKKLRESEEQKWERKKERKKECCSGRQF